MAGYPGYTYPNFQQYGMPQMQPNNPMNYFTQNMQQQLSQTQSPLKIVESIESVKLTDVPMDGNSYYFPKADGTEIYTKRWLANGSTEVVVYKRMMDTPHEEEKETFNFSEMENNIMEKLNSIDERFSKFEKGFASSKATVKKEG